MSLRKKVYSIIPTNFSLSKSVEGVDFKQHSLAIVIHTCDSYKFCWDGWYYYFKKYWDFNLPLNIYFVNENSNVNFGSVIQIKTGSGEWSTRLKKALEIIPEHNILYLQEDVWLKSCIDLKKYFFIFIAYKMSRLQLSPMDKTYTLFAKFKVGDNFNNFIRKFAKRSNYLISHQPSIWEKSFLLSCLSEEESPWVNEIEGTKRLRRAKKSYSIYLIVVDWYNAVSRQGKLTKDGLELEKILK